MACSPQYEIAHGRKVRGTEVTRTRRRTQKIVKRQFFIHTVRFHSTFSGAYLRLLSVF